MVLYDEENHGARKLSYYYSYTTFGKWTKPWGQEILILLLLLWYCMMNKTLWPGNFNSTTFMILYDEQNPSGSEGNSKIWWCRPVTTSNWKGIDSEILIERPSQSEFQIWSYREVTIPNLKGTDSNSNLKKPNQSEVQNLNVRPRVATSYN